jgi:disulfide oxidoreductase YuzD
MAFRHGVCDIDHMYGGHFTLVSAFPVTTKADGEWMVTVRDRRYPAREFRGSYVEDTVQMDLPTHPLN